IRGEQLVDKDHLAVVEAKLEFGVSQDEIARFGELLSMSIQRQAQVAQALRDGRAYQFLHSRKGHRFIMHALWSLGRRRKQRWLQTARLPQAGGEGEITYPSHASVILPSRSRQIATHHTLNRQWVSLLHQHA